MRVIGWTYRASSSLVIFNTDVWQYISSKAIKITKWPQQGRPLQSRCKSKLTLFAWLAYNYTQTHTCDMCHTPYDTHTHILQ